MWLTTIQRREGTAKALFRRQSMAQLKLFSVDQSQPLEAGSQIATPKASVRGVLNGCRSLRLSGGA